MQTLEHALSLDPASTIFDAGDQRTFSTFMTRPEMLGRIRRPAPDGGEDFFRALLPANFGVSGKVYGATAESDIQAAIDASIQVTFRTMAFYKAWVKDMADVSRLFAGMLGTDAVGFSLSTQRGCRRFHQDKVPMRLLVTYAGRGTEWVPDFAVDKIAYEKGAENSQILTDPSAIQWVDPWDIVVFKGAPNGLLHRTPDTAKPGTSVLMRLDGPEFWDYALADRQ